MTLAEKLTALSRALQYWGILIADYRSFLDRQERFKEVMKSLGLMLEPVDGSIKERAIPPYICRLAGITSMIVTLKTIEKYN